MLWLDHVVLLCLSRFHSLVSEVFLVHFSFPLVFICLPYILAMCATSPMSSRSLPRFLFMLSPRLPDALAGSICNLSVFSFASKIWTGCLWWIAFLLRFLLVGLRAFFSFLFICFRFICPESKTEKHTEKNVILGIYIWYYMIYTYTYIRYIYIYDIWPDQNYSLIFRLFTDCKA